MILIKNLLTSIDGYSNERGGGFIPELTRDDSVAYLKRQADEAAKYGMGIGLKNSQAILRNVSSFIQFAVNEECAFNQECGEYDFFLTSGKPVFQIEYGTQSDVAKSCTPGPRFSMVWKPEAEINGASYYCDGSHVTSATYPAPDKGGRRGGRP
jgi:Glycoside-hydrolase family GH114